MDSGKSKILDSHSLVINLSGKIDLKRNGKYVALLILSIYCTKIIDLKYQFHHGMLNLSYMTNIEYITINVNHY